MMKNCWVEIMLLSVLLGLVKTPHIFASWIYYLFYCFLLQNIHLKRIYVKKALLDWWWSFLVLFNINNTRTNISWLVPMPTDDILQGFTINLYSDGLLKQFFYVCCRRYGMREGFIKHSWIGSKLPWILSMIKIWSVRVLFILLQHGR